MRKNGLICQEFIYLFDVSNGIRFILQKTFFPKWDISIMFWWILTEKLAIINYSMEQMLPLPPPSPSFTTHWKKKKKHPTLDSIPQWIYMKNTKWSSLTNHGRTFVAQSPQLTSRVKHPPSLLSEKRKSENYKTS